MELAVLFIVLAALFGLFMAWGIDANDVANAVGPLAAVVSISANGKFGQEAVVSPWVLVGAVLGVGLVRGMTAINLRVVGTIFVSWSVTVPAGALLSVIFFFMLRAILG